MNNNDNSLTIAERIRLITGVGMWATFTANGKLPELMMTDGPHGLRKSKADSDNLDSINNSRPATCFPTASAIASSWNTESLKLMGESIADEAIAEHVAVVLGPGVNMKRSPLCGRNFEYFSEDPYLAGSLASAYINGMQGKGIGTCIKHYAVNNQETRRATENNMVDERALREIYLKAFEIATKESHPTAIMPSYNMINGYHGTENYHLLTELLRETFGFTGVAISDWGAATNLAEDILAGLDLEMPDSLGRHEHQLYDALESGRITEEDIIRTTDRMIAFIRERVDALANAEKSAGLPSIDDPSYEGKKAALQEQIFEKNHENARKLEEDSAVLLKNTGALPLAKGSKVIVIGEMAEKIRYQGAGSSHIQITRRENAIEALENAGCEVIYKKGYLSGTEEADASLEEEALDGIRSFRNQGESGIPVLYFCGLTDISEGEGYDRRSLEIPSNQKRLYEKVRQEADCVVAVTFGGSPMVLDWEKEGSEYTIEASADAILHMYLGGQAVASACANLLLGNANPSGKLAETWPKRIEDTPAYGNFALASDDVEYRESIFIGYRHYDRFDLPMQYPFGYGLSYTKFAYSDLKMTDPYTAELTVKNIGSVAGKEVVQFYALNPEKAEESRNMPYREKRKLVAFTKVDLKPDEEKTLRVKLSEDAYRIFDIDRNDWVTIPGTYEIQASASLTDVRCRAQVEIAESGETTTTMPKTFAYPYTSEQFRTVYHGEISDIDHLKPGEFTIYHSLVQLAPHSWMARAFIKFATRSVMKANKDKPADDPTIQMTLGCMKEFGIEAIACQANLPNWLVNAIVKNANKGK